MTNQQIRWEDYTINLPFLLDIENCLESFHTQYSTDRESEEIVKYFELLHSYADMDIAGLYKDKKVKVAINSALSLEIAAVLFHWYIVKQKLFDSVDQSEVLNMLRCIYQNFLLRVDCALRKLPPSEQHSQNNRWIKKLKALTSKYVEAKTSKSRYMAMIQNSSVISGLMNKFCSQISETEDYAKVAIVQAAQVISKNYTTSEPYKVVCVMLDAFESSISIDTDMQLKTMDTEPEAPIEIPYLPPKADYMPEYTLVLDLDETLIHQTESEQLLIRPKCREFLAAVSKHYEVVIFTAALKEYADCILDQLDPEQKLIQHRLYRSHTTYENDIYIKDLENLGRSLKKTFIVDNSPENFKLQKANGIQIESWYGNKLDQELSKLQTMLIATA